MDGPDEPKSSIRFHLNFCEMRDVSRANLSMGATMRAVNFAVVVVALASGHGCIPTYAGVSFGHETFVAAGRQGNQEVPVDTVLARRWAELFASVIGRFHSEHRDLLGNLEGDFTTREVRVRATSARDDDSLWVSRTLTENELRTADLATMAGDLYRAAKEKAGER